MEQETALVLTIALQDGFTDDLVVVRVNGREVCRKEGVKTKLMLGYADSFEVHVPEGPVNVEVTLPLRDLTETIVLQASKAVYLGFYIRNERIGHRMSYEPFGYL